MRDRRKTVLCSAAKAACDTACAPLPRRCGCDIVWRYQDIQPQNSAPAITASTKSRGQRDTAQRDTAQRDTAKDGTVMPHPGTQEHHQHHARSGPTGGTRTPRQNLTPGLGLGLTLVGVSFFGGMVQAASPAEAKATALANNCAPGKIEVLRHIPGNMPETVFKVECTDVKGQFVIIQCRVRQCVLLR